MKKLFCISLISLIFFCCAKENSEVFTPYNPADTVWTQQVLANAPVSQIPVLLATASRVDSVQASIGGVVRMSEFLNVNFPINAFTFASGNPVAGRIKFEVQHLRNKGDFIRFARPTTSYGRVLESGGAFLVKAFKEGQELVLAPGKSLTLSFVSPNPVNFMRVFYGQSNLTGPLPAGTNPAFTWVPAPDSASIPTFQRIDSTGIVRGYEMSVRNLQWVNCDYFLNQALPATRVNITLPPTCTNSNTTVYAVFKDQKVVVRLNDEVSSKTFTTVNIPIGKSVIFVSLTKIADDLYLASKEVLITAGFHTNLVPEKRTIAQIGQFLDGL